MLRRKLNLYCNLALLGAAFISGLSFVAQKLGMHYIGPATFNALRCFIGCVSLLPVLYLFNKIQYKKYDKKNLIKGGLIAGVVLFIAFSINQYSMIYAPAGKAGFITSLYVLFVPIIAVFMKHKLKNNVKISILIALFGLYLLCCDDISHFEIWDVLLLLSAFFFALHIIVLNCYSKKTNPIELSIVQFLCTGVLFLPFSLFFENPTINLILAGWKPILFIGVIVTAGAYTLQIFGHKATKPVLATLILSTEAVFAVLGGVVILNESLNIKEITGCIIMLFAIMNSQISNKKLITTGDKSNAATNTKQNL